MNLAPAGRKRPIVERVAGWSVRHRVIVVISWLLIVVAAFAVGQHLGTSNTNSYDPGQAGRAERILNEPSVQQPDGESVLIQGRSAAQTFAETRSCGRRCGRSSRRSSSCLTPPPTSSRRSPAAALANGRSALVTFNVAGKPGNDDTAVVPALNAVAAIQARHPDLTVAEAGGASVDRTASAQIGQDFRTAAVTSLPVTLVLLLIVFGALIAAGIPLLLAGTAVIAAISLLSIPSRIVPIDGTTSAIVLLVGMAVGIDYSLFYLRRVREERAAGRDTKEALRIAAATSGRAIAVSGLTVMISLAGLFLTGIDVFSGVAIGTILVVGVAVLGSLTFLPALLSLLGTATDRGRIPFLGRRRAAARPSRLWGLVVRAVVRHPLALGGLAAIALLALATPLLSLHLENPDLHAFPNSVPVIRTAEAIEQAFPGGPEPAEVVVTGDNLSGTGVSHAITALHAQVAATRGAIREPITTALFGAGQPAKDQVLVISVPLNGNGTNATSRQRAQHARHPGAARHAGQGAGDQLRGRR